MIIVVVVVVVVVSGNVGNGVSETLPERFVLDYVRYVVINLENSEAVCGNSLYRK